MTEDRYKINFSNPRIREFASALAISENRMSRDKFNSICTKDNYYALLHSNYIKENDGIITSTPKLRNEMERRWDIHISGSCSEEHSRCVSESLRFIPSEVLREHNFRTAADIEKDYAIEKNALESRLFEERVEELRQNFANEQERLKQEYNQRLEEANSEEELAHIRLEQARITDEQRIRESALESERPFLFPDYEISVTRNELDTLMERLYEESLINQERSELYENAYEKLQSIGEFEGRIAISIEVITDSYGNLEIERHTIYEEVSDTIQIMI